MTSGKTTLANYLERDRGFKKISFAEPIKRLESIQANIHPNSWRPTLEKYMEEYFPFIRDQKTYIDYFQEIFLSSEAMPGKKNRNLLQRIGHGARDLYENIWIDYALNIADKQKKKIVIDDVRYFNELEILNLNGFMTWRIEVHPRVQRERIKLLYGEKSLEYMDHDSEKQCDNLWELFDYVIDGNVDVVEMCDSVDYIFEEIEKKSLKEFNEKARSEANA